MVNILKQKSNIIYLCIIAIGLFVSGLTFVYYGFNLGIKPCEGLASDAANCGDADLGGVGFLLIGVPITLLGIISLVINLVLGYVKSKR
jgi:hypothetical protein